MKVSSLTIQTRKALVTKDEDVPEKEKPGKYSHWWNSEIFLTFKAQKDKVLETDPNIGVTTHQGPEKMFIHMLL